MAKRFFGELELNILTYLKSIASAVSVAEVHRAFKESQYTTILTVMQRLWKKGILLRNKVGSKHEYWINPEKSAGGKTAAAVSYLVAAEDELSEADLEEMARLIDRAKGRKK